MDQGHALRGKKPMHLVEVAAQIVQSHMLEHADAVTVILDAPLAPILQAALADSRAGQLILVLRQGDAHGLDTVALGRPHDQRPPTAADIQQRIPRPQA